MLYQNVSAEYWSEKLESEDFMVETQSEKSLNTDIVQRIIKVTNRKQVRKKDISFKPL